MDKLPYGLWQLPQGATDVPTYIDTATSTTPTTNVCVHWGGATIANYNSPPATPPTTPGIFLTKDHTKVMQDVPNDHKPEKEKDKCSMNSSDQSDEECDHVHNKQQNEAVTFDEDEPVIDLPQTQAIPPSVLATTAVTTVVDDTYSSKLAKEITRKAQKAANDKARRKRKREEKLLQAGEKKRKHSSDTKHKKSGVVKPSKKGSSKKKEKSHASGRRSVAKFKTAIDELKTMRKDCNRLIAAISSMDRQIKSIIDDFCKST